MNNAASAHCCLLSFWLCSCQVSFLARLNERAIHPSIFLPTLSFLPGALWLFALCPLLSSKDLLESSNGICLVAKNLVGTLRQLAPYQCIVALLYERLYRYRVLRPLLFSFSGWVIRRLLPICVY